MTQATSIGRSPCAARSTIACMLVPLPETRTPTLIILRSFSIRFSDQFHGFPVMLALGDLADHEGLLMEPREADEDIVQLFLRHDQHHADPTVEGPEELQVVE